MMNDRSAFKKFPYVKLAPWIGKTNADKSVLPIAAAINGFMRSLTSEPTILVKAAPIMTATARSAIFPRRIKSRKLIRVCIAFYLAQLKEFVDKPSFSSQPLLLTTEGITGALRDAIPRLPSTKLSDRVHADFDLLSSNLIRRLEISSGVRREQNLNVPSAIVPDL